MGGCSGTWRIDNCCAGSACDALYMCATGAFACRACRAYCDAFTIEDDVSLFIHTNYKGKFDKTDVIMEAIQSYIDLEVIGKTQHRCLEEVCAVLCCAVLCCAVLCCAVLL